MAGGSLIIAFKLFSQARVQAAQAEPSLPGSLSADPAIDSWLQVNPNGTVTVFTGKVELGQGIKTAFAQIVADELDVPLERIQMVTADTARTPDEGFTAGSLSIENGGSALRVAAAEARQVLLELASRRLGAPPEHLQVRDGVVSVRGTPSAASPSVTYWDLLGGQRFGRRATGTVPVKGHEQYRVVGQPIPRLDIPGKVTGQPSYVQDLRLPGMLHGRVLRPPSYGARLEAIDLDEVRRLPGVVAVVRDGHFVGVIAQREEQAIRAVQRLRQTARWKLPEALPSMETLSETLEKLPTRDQVILAQGDADFILGSSRQVVEARYFRPYQAHASIGPSCAVAQWNDGQLTVWTHSQGVYPLRRDLAKVLGLPEERIRVVHMEGAGCYGHNGADDAACDAALLARAANGRPVRVQWMREDEFGWEPFGSAMVMRVRAGLDESGRIVAWDYHVWSASHSTRPGARGGSGLLAGWHLQSPVPAPPPTDPGPPAGGGDRNAVPLYVFPHARVVKHFIADSPLRVSALRSLGAYANVFAIESFMDELAARARLDPVEFRLLYLRDPRARAVIEAAVRLARWTPGPGPTGRGQGIGFARYKNHAAYAAVVAHVEVDRSTGQVWVRKVAAAVDAGLIINPDGLRNQIEGGVIQSTSWTLKEQVTFDGEGIRSRDWRSYPILTFPEVPDVAVELINRPDQPALGVGECVQGPTAAAIANAIFDATGVRLRELPLTAARLRAALG